MKYYHVFLPIKVLCVCILYIGLCVQAKTDSKILNFGLLLIFLENMHTSKYSPQLFILNCHCSYYICNFTHILYKYSLQFYTFKTAKIFLMKNVLYRFSRMEAESLYFFIFFRWLLFKGHAIKKIFTQTFFSICWLDL